MENLKAMVAAWEANGNKETFTAMVEESFAAQNHAPKFKHDCDSCLFLGHFEDKDIYWCPYKRMDWKHIGTNLDSIILRYDDEDSRYFSHLVPEGLSAPAVAFQVIANHNPAYAVALKRAKAVGLYKGKF